MQSAFSGQTCSLGLLTLFLRLGHKWKHLNFVKPLTSGCLGFVEPCQPNVLMAVDFYRMRPTLVLAGAARILCLSSRDSISAFRQVICKIAMLS